MPIRKVALVGATGRLGPAILHALESAFTVTVLQRQSSNSALPSGSRSPIVKFPDDFSVSALTEALKGQDALVVTMPGSLADQHITLAQAAAEAGVRRFMPPDFGSVDSSDAVVAELVPLYRHKNRVRERCQELSQKYEHFSWTSLVCGHFFDYGLESGLLGFDLEKKTAEIFDDGERKWSASTLKRIGEAVVKTLQKEEETKDKMLYVQSFSTSQADVLEALMSAGGQMEVTFKKSQDYIDRLKVKVKVKDGNDPHATEEMVSVLGMTRAYWEEKDGFANQLLGLEPEEMPKVVKEVVGKALTKK